MREARVDHQVLVTTLIDERQVGKDDLSALYAQRWNVELDRGGRARFAGPRNQAPAEQGKAGIVRFSRPRRRPRPMPDALHPRWPPMQRR